MGSYVQGDQNDTDPVRANGQVPTAFMTRGGGPTRAIHASMIATVGSSPDPYTQSSPGAAYRMGQKCEALHRS